MSEGSGVTTERTVAGYRLRLREAGTHADVWDGTDLALDRPLVVLTCDADDRERLMHAARAYAKVASRSVPALLASGTSVAAEGAGGPVAWCAFEKTPSAERIVTASVDEGRVILRELASALDALESAGFPAHEASITSAVRVGRAALLADPCTAIASKPALSHAAQRALARLAYELFAARPPEEVPARFEVAKADASRMHAAFMRALAATPGPFFDSCMAFVRELDACFPLVSAEEVAAAVAIGAVPPDRSSIRERLSQTLSLTMRPSMVLRRKTHRVQNVLMGLGIVVIATLIVLGRRSPDDTRNVAAETMASAAGSAAGALGPAPQTRPTARPTPQPTSPPWHVAPASSGSAAFTPAAIVSAIDNAANAPVTTQRDADAPHP